jgi:hypothetical protein
VHDKYFVPVSDIVVRGRTYEAGSIYTITKDIIPELFSLMRDGKVQTYGKVIVKKVNVATSESVKQSNDDGPIEQENKSSGYNL